MYAVEFEAVIKDRMIVIPEMEASHLSDRVKVILLSEASERVVPLSKFDAIHISTKGFRFNREDANER